jgi:hypothetical protein
MSGTDTAGSSDAPQQEPPVRVDPAAPGAPSPPEGPPGAPPETPEVPDPTQPGGG